jgi:hypothetical protein
LTIHSDIDSDSCGEWIGGGIEDQPHVEWHTRRPTPNGTFESSHRAAIHVARMSTLTMK